jgi:hypothetical protein
VRTTRQRASPSPSAHARDVWANTARIALSWLVPAAVVLLVVMVFPFWFSCRQAVAADLVRLGGLRGYLAAAGDAVGESPEGGYLQQRVALAEGFVNGDEG